MSWVQLIYYNMCGIKKRLFTAQVFVIKKIALANILLISLNNPVLAGLF